MCTRSGRVYRIVSRTETSAMSEEQSGSTGESISVTDMMKLLLEDRRMREEEVAQERRRREQEMAEERHRRKEEMMAERHPQQEQIDRLMQLVEASQTRGEARTSSAVASEKLKLSKLTEQDNIEAYLTTFERMMAVYEVDRARWA